MQWSTAILDKYIAPEITVFTSADVPDLQPEFSDWRHWITNHFLNNVFRGVFREPWRQYALNFIRRSQTTFRFYHVARDATLKYVADNEPSNPKVGQYYEALAAWEVVFMNWAICLDLVRQLNGEDIFKKNDGSSEQRAYSMNNTIKHHALDIHSGRLVGDDNLPFWLTQAGFKSKSDELSYFELADLIRDVAKLSTELQDVRTFIDNGKSVPSS